MNPDLDLTLDRVIKAPPATVWKAWTDPVAFSRWWLPAPYRCRVERLDVRPGGGLVTSMSEDGSVFVPQPSCATAIPRPARGTRSWASRTAGAPWPLSSRPSPKGRISAVRR